MSQETRWLICLCLFALILRLIIPVTQQTSDSPLYLELAGQIRHGHLSIERFNENVRFVQPGYSAIIAFVNVLVRDVKTSAIAVSVVSGALLVWLVFLLARSLSSVRVAWLSAIVIAIHPMFVSYSGRVLTESIFAFVVISVVYLFWRLRHSTKSWHFFVVGLLIGFAYLVRFVGLALLAGPLVYFIYQYYKKSITFFSAFKFFLILCIGALVVAGPYVYYLSRQYDALTITGLQSYYVGSYAQQALSNQDTEGSETAVSKFAFQYRLNDALNDYISVVGGQTTTETAQSVKSLTVSFIKNIPYNAKFIVINFLFEIIACIVIFIFWRQKAQNFKPLKYIYVLVWAGAIVLIPLIGRPLIRYYYAAVPLLVILTMAGFDILVARVRNTIFRSFIIIGFLIVYPAYCLTVSGLVFNQSFVKISRASTVDFAEEAGRAFQQAFGPGQKVITNNRVFSYYSGGWQYPVPYARIPEIVAFANNNAIGYLVINTRISGYSGVGLDSLVHEYDEQYVRLWRVIGDQLIYTIVDRRGL